jgi:sensor histidine kinase YesM
MSLGWAILNAAVNVLTAALLGLLGLGLPGRLPWPGALRPWFVVAHLVLALLFTTLWFGTLMGGLGVIGYLRSGTWAFVIFRGAALHWQLFQGLLLYTVIVGVAYAAHAFRQLRKQEERAVRAELQASHAEALRSAAELQALRAQLNPHFIFNTLHTLQALVRYDPTVAEAALEQLGGLLRYALRRGTDQHELDGVRLSEEWAFTRDYLALEELRLESRLRIVAELTPESLNCMIPPLTLQPLVENAIKHAIAPYAAGGTIWIRAHRDGDQLLLEVRDNGPGARPEGIAQAEGLGLRTIGKRLEARYGSDASMTIDTAPTHGLSVLLRIPGITANVGAA